MIQTIIKRVLFIQRNNDPKYVPFLKLWILPRIILTVFEQISHAGSQSVSSAYIPEKGCYDRILRIRLQIIRSDNAFPESPVRIFRIHPFFLNHKFCRIGTGKFPMHQYIADHFPCKNVSKADPAYIFQKKFIRQMLSCKIHQLIKTFDQVRPNNLSVIISVSIDLTYKSIRFICRTGIHNHIIFTQ